MIFGDEAGWSSSTEMRVVLGLLEEDDFVSSDGVSPVWITFSLFVKITQQHLLFFSLERSVIWSDKIVFLCRERGIIQIAYLLVVGENQIPIGFTTEHNFDRFESVLNVASNAESVYGLYILVHGFNEFCHNLPVMFTFSFLYSMEHEVIFSPFYLHCFITEKLGLR